MLSKQTYNGHVACLKHELDTAVLYNVSNAIPSLEGSTCIVGLDLISFFIICHPIRVFWHFDNLCLSKKSFLLFFFLLIIFFYFCEFSFSGLCLLKTQTKLLIVGLNGSYGSKEKVRHLKMELRKSG